jgi:hypothetical protein
MYQLCWDGRMSHPRECLSFASHVIRKLSIFGCSVDREIICSTFRPTILCLPTHICLKMSSSSFIVCFKIQYCQGFKRVVFQQHWTTALNSFACCVCWKGAVWKPHIPDTNITTELLAPLSSEFNNTKPSTSRYCFSVRSSTSIFSAMVCVNGNALSHRPVSE